MFKNKKLFSTYAMLLLLWSNLSCSKSKYVDAAGRAYVVAVFYDPLQINQGSESHTRNQQAIDELCALLKTNGGVLYLCRITAPEPYSRVSNNSAEVTSLTAFFLPEYRLIGIAENVDPQLVKDFFQVPATIYGTVSEAVRHIKGRR